MSGNVAFVEECNDDDGSSSLEGIQGTRRYARSEIPITPTKERPNTSKSRADRPSSRRHESASSSDVTSHSSKGRDDRQEREMRRQKEADRQRREDDRRRREIDRHNEVRRTREEKLSRELPPKALKKTRPAPPKHAATQPIIDQGSYRRGHVDDPRYFGVQQPAISGPRPRQQRPASYYAGQPIRPPMPNMGWQMPPGPFPIGTFPPPGTSPSMHGLPPMSPMGPPADYFDNGPPPSHHGRQLRDRFERFEHRPSSAMGFSPSQRSYMPDEYEYEEDMRHGAPRPPPRSRKQEDDRRAMPPPKKPAPRPKTAAAPRTPFAPPMRPASRQSKPPRTQPSHRRSIGYPETPGYDDDDFQGEQGLFHDLSPEPNYGAGRALARTRRGSLLYDDDEYDVMPAKSRGRRASTYGSSLTTGGVSLEEDKYLGALQYQDDVAGGPQMPLTAETLKRANSKRDVASSRSTRSSASRDESEYKRSNATGLTRSSSGNDDYKVTIHGAATVRLPDGAEIECRDGGMTLSGGGVRLGSELASSAYQIEEPRSRFKALPHRARAPSQSDSQSRSYAPSRASYYPEDYDPDYDVPYPYDDDY